MSILNATHLKKYYGKDESLVKALDEVNVSVENGQFVAIIGTSGSGKSTLLNMLGGLDIPTEGSVQVENKNLEKLTEEQLTVFRRQRIGFIFQNYNLIPCVFDATGHSLGGVCYYFPKDKMVFVGDLIMHGGYINLQNIPGANLQKYAESVIALEKLEVEQFYSGHGNFSLNRGKIHIEKAAKAFRNLGVPPNFV